MIFTMISVTMGLSHGLNTGNALTEYVLESVAGTTDYQRVFKPGTIEQQYPNGEYGMSLNCLCHSGKYEAETVEECHQHCVMEEGCGYFQLYAEGYVCWTFPEDLDLGRPEYRFDVHHELDIRIYKLPGGGSGNQLDGGNDGTDGGSGNQVDTGSDNTDGGSGDQVDTGNDKTAYVLEDVEGSTEYQRMFKPGTTEKHYPKGEYGLALNCNCHSGKYEAEKIDECYNYCLMEVGCGYFQLYAEGGVCWTFPEDIDLGRPEYFLEEFHELDIRMYKPYPTEQPTPTPSADPTAVPTPMPSAEPTANPTSTPSADPTAVPTPTPSAEPTAYPTSTPSAAPTAVPTPMPSAEPTAVSIGWHLAPKGARTCSRGVVASQSECAAAVASLAQAAGRTPGRAMVVGWSRNCRGGWGKVPIGCSAQSGGDWAAHYKTSGPASCSHNIYQLVCSGN